MNHITSINKGKPNNLLVTNASMICVVFSACCEAGVYVSARAPEIKPYFSCAISDDISLPLSENICSSLAVS